MTHLSPDKRLLELLAARGIAGSIGCPAAAWDAFKEVGREYFGSAGVDLLFQAGNYGFDEPRFVCDPVCQFEVLDDEGEHDHFEQTHLEMSCDLSGDLRGHMAQLWSSEFSSPEEFFAAVEALPEFHLAMKPKQYRLNVSHEAV
jgi:hypothetical protein